MAGSKCVSPREWSHLEGLDRAKVSLGKRYLGMAKVRLGNGLEGLGRIKVRLGKGLEDLGRVKVGLGKGLEGLGRTKVQGLEGLGRTTVRLGNVEARPKCVSARIWGLCTGIVASRQDFGASVRAL